MSLMAKKSKEIETALTDSGVRDFDPTKIVDFIKKMIALFAGCALMTPAKAQQRVRLLSQGRWYPGRNLDENRLRRIVEDSDCCQTDDTLDAVCAATLDVGGHLSVADFAALYAEV